MEYFDLHCDTATAAYDRGLHLDDERLMSSTAKKPEEMNHCQAYAIFIPDELRGEQACEYYRKNIDYFKLEAERFSDKLAVCRGIGDIDCAFAENKTAAVLAVEGGAAIGGSCGEIYKMAEDGVKFFTLTWNGENEIGHGCASTGGLKRFGRDAVSALVECGITVDISHLSDEGVYDVLSLTDRPVVATHSNLRSVCAHRRNLTEEMFCELISRNGLVGLNLFTKFISDDEADECSFLRHIYRMLELGGENIMAMGSDFDGAAMPRFCSDLRDIDRLYELVEVNFDQIVAQKIFSLNARKFMKINF
ncbi:MAG: membrane dipeptidase [Oscillospiraceae bacterium]